jgi:diguanylate cyclase
MGDELLQSVAERLRTCVRKSDTLSRQDGDEFMIVLPKVTHAADAGISAANILSKLREVHSIGKHSIHITASIGISTYPEHGEDPETLIKYADTACIRPGTWARQLSVL